jgi:hypothetical protein
MIQKRLLSGAATLAAIILVLTGKFGLYDSNESVVEDETQSITRGTAVSSVSNDVHKLRDEKKRQGLSRRDLFSLAFGHVQKNSQRDTDSLGAGVEEAFADAYEISEPHFMDMGPSVLEEMFQTQLPDNFWTKEIQTMSDGLWTDAAFDGTILENVDCRETLCKMEFYHNNKEAHDTFLMQGINIGPWNTSAGETMGGQTAHDDGSVTTNVIFSRTGDFETFKEMRTLLAQKLSID